MCLARGVTIIDGTQQQPYFAKQVLVCMESHGASEWVFSMPLLRMFSAFSPEVYST